MSSNLPILRPTIGVAFETSGGRRSPGGRVAAPRASAPEAAVVPTKVESPPAEASAPSLPVDDVETNEAAVRLRALQTRQQLSIQSFSIANQSSQLILTLFQ
jgi:hypothetical protein